MEVKAVSVVVKNGRVVSFEHSLTITNSYRYKVNVRAKADKT